MKSGQTFGTIPTNQLLFSIAIFVRLISSKYNLDILTSMTLLIES